MNQSRILNFVDSFYLFSVLMNNYYCAGPQTHYLIIISSISRIFDRSGGAPWMPARRIWFCNSYLPNLGNRQYGSRSGTQQHLRVRHLPYHSSGWTYIMISRCHSLWLGLSSSELRVAGMPFFLFIFARFSIFFLAPHVRGVRNKIASAFGQPCAPKNNNIEVEGIISKSRRKRCDNNTIFF